MSLFTKARDAITGTVAPIANMATGGLLGTLGGATGLGGITSLLGGAGGLMGLLGGGFGQGMNSGGSFGTPMAMTGFGDTGQFGSLMDMLGQKYGQQGQVSPTGNANLSNQGLI